MMTPYPASLKRLVIFAFCLLLMLAIAWMDYKTGTEINISVFYTLPVAVATWFLNPLAGTILAVLGTMNWEYADLKSGIHATNLFVFFWNTFVRFSYLLLVAYLLARLRSAFDRERERSRIDPLTGLANVRGFQEAVGMELRRLEREGKPVSVLFLDCDDFKSVNDRHGHAAGDRLLQRVGRGIRAHIRPYDIAGRLGGDEFAAVLPGAGLEEARRAAERIVAEVGLAVDGLGSVSMSAGVAAYARPPATVDDLLKPADALLYEAKSAGKNRVHASEVTTP
jgi:diguanylate cyclase (GGDEF)-like protein